MYNHVHCTFCVTQFIFLFVIVFLSLPVYSDPQTPPIASAGPPVTITLPQDTVSLDGSKSADDFGIESYQWVRSSNSLAAGVREQKSITCFTILFHLLSLFPPPLLSPSLSLPLLCLCFHFFLSLGLSPLPSHYTPQSVVDGSDKKPVLVLSGLVSGTYNFTLTVTNKYGKSAMDTVTLTVLPNPLDPYIIQAQLEGNISNFTQANKVCT